LYAFLLAAVMATPALAQGGSADPTGDFSSHAAIQQRLAVAESEIAALDGSADDTVREMLQQLQTALYQHLEAVEYLDTIRQQAVSVSAEARSWKGFDQQPPYPIQLADDLRAQEQALRQEQRATESRLRIVRRAIDDAAGKLDDHQRAARRFMEDADNASNAGDRQTAQQAARQEDLQSRILAETVARLQIRRASQEVQVKAVQAALELNELKIQEMRGKIRFTQADLDDIQKRIATERSKVLKAASAEQDGVPDSGRQVTWRLDILDIERDFWNALYSILSNEDPAVRRAAVGTLKALKVRADDWVELIRLNLQEAVRSDGGEQIGEHATTDDVRRVVKVQSQLEFALEELGAEGISGPSPLSRMRDVLLSIWDMELYLAEETESVGGQKVTTYRAVTLGKLLRLAFILTVGWFLLRFISRRVRAFVMRRPNVDPGAADAAGGWTFGIGLAILVLIGLNRVHIPFTAFAFLGGTLAIGIGFGAQTLLKNFISGVILSFERPFKVGDLVQVEDILGYIQSIGLRASVIRHFDGTDTLVPNSTLLESRVSNWTFGDTSMRGEVKVGVAYGTPTRDVSRTLLGVAEAHGLVLDQPAPSVQFEAFGDNTLNFRLLYWFDASKTRPHPLASDLRFMIDKAFREQGIVIAYPQRDIHFDDSKPLRIELSRRRLQAGEAQGED